MNIDEILGKGAKVTDALDGYIEKRDWRRMEDRSCMPNVTVFDVSNYLMRTMQRGFLAHAPNALFEHMIGNYKLLQVSGLSHPQIEHIIYDMFGHVDWRLQDYPERYVLTSPDARTAVFTAVAALEALSHDSVYIINSFKKDVRKAAAFKDATKLWVAEEKLKFIAVTDFKARALELGWDKSFDYKLPKKLTQEFLKDAAQAGFECTNKAAFENALKGCRIVLRPSMILQHFEWLHTVFLYYNWVIEQCKLVIGDAFAGALPLWTPRLPMPFMTFLGGVRNDRGITSKPVTLSLPEESVKAANTVLRQIARQFIYADECFAQDSAEGFKPAHNACITAIDLIFAVLCDISGVPFDYNAVHDKGYLYMRESWYASGFVHKSFNGVSGDELLYCVHSLYCCLDSSCAHVYASPECAAMLFEDYAEIMVYKNTRYVFTKVCEVLGVDAQALLEGAEQVIVEAVKEPTTDSVVVPASNTLLRRMRKLLHHSSVAVH